MKYLTGAILLIPVAAFAAAGFADRYYDHQQWIIPAYRHCLIFGLLILFVLGVISLIFRTKTQKVTGAISSFLIRHRILAIIVTGVLLAIPLGITISASWEIIWLMAMFPALASIVALPICLANRRFREKFMLSPRVIQWTSMLSVSAIAASLLFIVLTNHHMLSGTDITHVAGRVPPYEYLTHPYGSMKEIWSMPLFFIAEIPVAIILYCFGLLNRYLSRKYTDLRQRRQTASQ